MSFMSDIIASTIMLQGLNNIIVPFKDIDGKPVPISNFLMDVAKHITIPTYSTFVPNEKRAIADLQHLQRIDRQHNIYILPKELTTTPVISVLGVKLPQTGARGTFGDINPAFGINRSIQGVLAGQAHMMIAGQMRAEPTFEYLGENKIQLSGWPMTLLEFRVSARHDVNGESLKPSCYESFQRLFLIDVKQALYNTLKHYNEIPTAHGNINLRIEDLQSAEQERVALIDSMKEVFHLDLDFTQFM